MGYSTAYVCISKTPNSFTDDPKILGAPEGHTVHIRDVKLYAGANLIVPLSGSLMLMPGLPKEPRCLDKNIELEIENNEPLMSLVECSLCNNLLLLCRNLSVPCYDSHIEDIRISLIL